MQNRLKFRFWHKPTNKMVDCYGFNEDFVFGDTLDGVGTNYNPAKFEDCILMQSTGLKDKNGKLIYEGDIVKDLTYSHNVVYLCAYVPIFGGLGMISYNNFRDYNFCKQNWINYNSNSEVRRLDNRFKLANQGNNLNCFSMTKLIMDKYEVIGNIYENRELLECQNG